MQHDTALPWLALSLTRGITARLSARLLKQSARRKMFFARHCGNWKGANCPLKGAGHPQKEAFKRVEKELAAIRGIPGCQQVNWSEPEYPQTLLQIHGL